MSQPFRTQAGGRIRRDRPVVFQFDGRSYTGYDGDTLASALLANDVHLIGRSFKFHRPRGVLSAGSEEPNALVTIDRGGGRTTPNLRATQVELHQGLRARSQNRFPSLRFDVAAAAGFVSPLLSAGFYYKTFMWPPSFWQGFYEPAIRAAAGLGRAPSAPDPDRYLHRYAHCDVLVVGAGPAGLAAALAASSGGARVILCDEQAEPGGSLLDEISATIDGWAVSDWLRETLTLLAERVIVLPRTTAFGWYADNMIGLAERVTDHLAEPPSHLPRERLWQVRAAEVVLATGAIERPLVFPHNDRPGIMLADSARTYLHRYGVQVGGHVVIATSDDSAYRVALDLQRAGTTVAAILDQRGTPEGETIEAARKAGLPIYTGTTIAMTDGRRRVHTVRPSGSSQVIPCDTVLMSGGWTPSVQLFSQSRGTLRHDAATGAFLPDQPAPGVRTAGACAGVFDLADCLESGWVAGGGGIRRFTVVGVPFLAPSGAQLPTQRHGKAFVDFQNDVTTKDLHVATQEGFRSIEHVKRYTTTGMATDQGRTSNLNALAIVADLQRQPISALGLTTFRPPVTPVTFGALAGAARGELFDPIRTSPIAAPDALFEDVGTWRRPRCFPHDSETAAEAVVRECHAVRNAVGILDASTLGKIEVVGADAAEFLNRVYAGDIARLSPGRCRYALLLGEDGFVRDDGVVARLDATRFHVTTTTGGAAGVLHHMEDYLQTEFPHLRVWLTSTTEQWAVIAVQGPRACDVVSAVLDDINISAMQHMSVREGHCRGVPARLFRVSFTGEVGFEINVPAGYGQRIWDAVLKAGSQIGITRYGTDAMHVLRAEKGYIVVGQETDGTVTPGDLGLDWMIARTESDFVGKRSLRRLDMQRADRLQLVGLLTRDPNLVLQEGAQIVAGPSVRATSLGHVTSAFHSDTLWRSIALALVAGGRGRIGSTLYVSMQDRDIEVTVTDPVFYDKPGARLAAQAVAGQTPPAVAGRTPRAAASDELPAPASPLGIGAPRGEATVASSSVRLTPLAPTLRLNIRANMAAATTIGAAIGVILGSAPNRAVSARQRVALWLGPDEWLVLAPLSETGLASHAAAVLGAAQASIVDVSHRTIAFEISGQQAALCLNAFCALDLDLHNFPADMCTRTLLGKAAIVLWRLSSDMFYVEVARSYGAYVWQCLDLARQEFLDPASSC